MFKRSILIATTLAPALLLGACGGTQNRGLESVHQPIVSRNDYVFDVASGGVGLAPGEAQRLAGWMQSIKVGYGDKIAVDDPGGHGPSPVRDDVQALAARYGLLVSDDVPVTAAPVAPGTVRVIVSRMKADVPGCPDYSRPNQANFDQHTSSNYGCAMNANLASMMANPADLVRGQPGADATDAFTATKAIDAFRKSTPTGGGGSATKSAGGN